jgi:hypothetical protein
MLTETKIERVQRLRKNERDRRRRANVRFQEANAAGKRVIIAKDVLRQLNLGKIIAKTGTYLKSDTISDIIMEIEYYGNSQKGDQQLCDIFSGIDSCKACALGSVFVATVKIADKLKFNEIEFDSWGDTIHSDSMHEYLEDFFSLRQLYMIENAFERKDINTIYQVDEALSKACIAFNKGVKSSRERLERIMENVIRNNGTFIPFTN